MSQCHLNSLPGLYLLCGEDCCSPPLSSTRVPSVPPNRKQLALKGPPPPFICWPPLKGRMQLRRGHCLGNKGQLLSHDLTRGTAAVNRFYALLMFSRYLFLLTKCFFKQLCLNPGVQNRLLKMFQGTPISISFAQVLRFSISRKAKNVFIPQVPRLAVCFEHEF